MNLRLHEGASHRCACHSCLLSSSWGSSGLRRAFSAIFFAVCVRLRATTLLFLPVLVIITARSLPPTMLPIEHPPSRHLENVATPESSKNYLRDSSVESQRGRSSVSSGASRTSTRIWVSLHCASTTATTFDDSSTLLPRSVALRLQALHRSLRDHRQESTSSWLSLCMCA